MIIKHCTMNCSTGGSDMRSKEQLKATCEDCYIEDTSIARERDRLRFPDANFNHWLDEAITENGEFTVWHNIKSVASAWDGWQNSRMIAKDDAVRAVETRAHPTDEIFVETATEAIKGI
jgi:hypothetical protein